MQYRAGDEGCISSAADAAPSSNLRDTIPGSLTSVALSISIPLLHVSRCQWGNSIYRCLPPFRPNVSQDTVDYSVTVSLHPPDNCTIRFRRNRTEIRGHGSVHWLVHTVALCDSYPGNDKEFRVARPN